MTTSSAITKSAKFPLAVILSFIIALILAIIPLPDKINFYRPEWLVLFLICWIIKFPLKIGFVAAFILGFFLDSLYNVPLGVHSFALVLSAYLLCKFCRRFDFFSFWQKISVIFGVIFVYELPPLFYELFTSHVIDFKTYFIPVIISTLIWPGIVVVLDLYCEKLDLK